VASGEVSASRRNVYTSNYIQSSSMLRFPRGPAARIRAAFAALPPRSRKHIKWLLLPCFADGPSSPFKLHTFLGLYCHLPFASVYAALFLLICAMSKSAVLMWTSTGACFSMIEITSPRLKSSSRASLRFGASPYIAGIGLLTLLCMSTGHAQSPFQLSYPFGPPCLIA
jgi:hypothetical protein